MNRHSRVTILARWVENGDLSYLETPRSRIRFSVDRLADVRRAYRLADGSRTVAEISHHGIPEDELLALLGELEDVGACVDVKCAAMIGHHYADWPDPAHEALDDAKVLSLQRLPVDPDGEFVALDAVLDEADAQRRTVRTFDPRRSVHLDDVDRIVRAAYGHRGDRENDFARVVPSAGAMYPLQLDLFARSCEGLRPGHYRFSKRRDGLVRLLGSQRFDAFVATLFEPVARDAAFAIVIGFDIVRSASKYSSRAYRFALLEAGHVAQNAMRAAGQLEVGSWEYGGYRDTELASLCDLDKSTTGIATVLLFGFEILA